MPDALVESLIILVLIGLNGLLSMSEIAIVSARKTRLMHDASQGDKAAQEALHLNENPSHVLSAIQVGITLIGVLTGAFAGATIAELFAQQLSLVGLAAPLAETIAVSVIVVVVTYLSVVVGELIPKRIALKFTDTIAKFSAKPLMIFAKITSPLVLLLAGSTDAFLKLFGWDKHEESFVSEEELKVIIDEGAKTGVLDAEEHALVAKILDLSDRKVKDIMTPRPEITWLDTNSPWDINLEKVKDSTHVIFPVGEGDLDHLLGVVSMRKVLCQTTVLADVDIRTCLDHPLLIPKNKTIFGALNLFRETRAHIAIVVDEYGGVQGLLTLNDIIDEMLGGLPSDEDPPRWHVIEREEGGWLLDGLMPVHEFAELFKLDLPEEHTPFRTLAGFVTHTLERIPAPADTFCYQHLTIEVVDMDRYRVDKVLVKTKKSESEDSAADIQPELH